MSNKSVFTIDVASSDKVQLLEITDSVAPLVRGSGVRSGVCHIFTPHTTAAVTINENADPDVRKDIIKGLGHMVPEDIGYDHAEGNSAAHIKASIFGNSSSLPVDNGELLLGTWQGIYLCEFDGLRKR